MKKMFYTIKETSDLVGENESTLRFWEGEFKEIRPRRSSGGKRLYSNADIELLKKIKYLLRERKISIEGAKEQLSGKSEELDLIGRLEEVKRVLE
ncbi:MerR family transcriptional regulator [candidate division WOR-3 bacterium]|nr:MerR family transcriptional regulator [candidate division WOR-3 bacterium]